MNEPRKIMDQLISFVIEIPFPTERKPLAGRSANQ